MLFYINSKLCFRHKLNCKLFQLDVFLFYYLKLFKFDFNLNIMVILLTTYVNYVLYAIILQHYTLFLIFIPSKQNKQIIAKLQN